MADRMNLAVQKKCDGLDLDNVDGYENDSGFPITADDQFNYNHYLAEQSHNRNLSVGLKNDLDQVFQNIYITLTQLQVKELEPFFDFAINEQCVDYSECDTLLPFVQNNKVIFILARVNERLSLEQNTTEA